MFIYKMKLNNQSGLTKVDKDKGCKKNRTFCCKSSSSSSCSSSSSSSSCSSSSSSSSCSSSSSSSNGSYDCLKAKYGVITTLSGTTSNFDNAYFNNLNITNDLNCNIPTSISGNTTINIPGKYSDLSQVYLLSAAANLTFGKFTSAFNGVRLVFVNTTGGSINVTFTVNSGDSIATGSGAISVATLSSIEYVGLWNSGSSSMVFYRIR